MSNITAISKGDYAILFSANMTFVNVAENTVTIDYLIFNITLITLITNYTEGM